MIVSPVTLAILAVTDLLPTPGRSRGEETMSFYSLKAQWISALLTLLMVMGCVADPQGLLPSKDAEIINSETDQPKEDAGTNVVTPPIYVDSDGDGFGTGKSQENWLCKDRPYCDLVPSGYAARDGDCDDNNPEINPLATEQPDGIDNNCISGVDEGWIYVFQDHDGDGYPKKTEPVLMTGAEADQSGYMPVPVDFDPATQLWDCDDTRNDVNPGTEEWPANAVDENCDGFEECYVDNDGDNFAREDAEIVLSPVLTCIAPGITPNHGQGGDCNDSNPEVNPLHGEVLDNGIDDNCNSIIDEDWCFDGTLLFDLDEEPTMRYAEIYLRVIGEDGNPVSFTTLDSSQSEIRATEEFWRSDAPAKPNTATPFIAMDRDGGARKIMWWESISHLEVRVAGWRNNPPSGPSSPLDPAKTGAAYALESGEDYGPAALGTMWCHDTFQMVVCDPGLNGVSLCYLQFSGYR